MSYSKCLEVIKEAAPDLTDDEIDGLVTELQRRQKLLQATNAALGSEEAALKAAAQLGKDLQAAALLEKRNAALNLKARLTAQEFISRNFSDKPYEGLDSLLVGTNLLRMGSRDSAYTRQQAKLRKYMEAFIADLRKSNLEDVLKSGEMDLDIARAMQDVRKGQPSKGPAEARQLAEIMVKHQEAWRVELNSNGAWIGKLDDYIVRQSHDAMKIRRAGFETWKASIYDKLDWNRIMERMPDADPDEFLKNVYNGLATGNHLKSGNESPSGFKGPANLAKKLSQDRVLHFKDADGWFAYNQKYGTGNLREAFVAGMAQTAQSVGLFRTLGTNPRAMLDTLISDLRKSDPAAIDRGQERALHNRLATLDGTTRVPVNQVMAQVQIGVVAMENMTRLGGAIMSQFGDIPVLASEMKYQSDNSSFLGSVFQTVARMAEGKGSKALQEIDAKLGAIPDSFIAEIGARYSLDNPVTGGVARAQDMFFRLNLMRWWQETMERVAARWMSNRLADAKANDWSKLDAGIKRVMTLHNIDEAKWDVIRQVDTKGADGRDYLVPEAIRDLPDELFTPLVQDKIDSIRQSTFEKISSLVERAAKETEWVENRKKKLAEYQDNLAEILNRYISTRDSRVAERVKYVEAQKELLNLKVEKAQIQNDIDGYLATQAAQGRARKFLKMVEDGKSIDRKVVRERVYADRLPDAVVENFQKGESVGEKSDRATENYGRNINAAAEELGRRMGRTERRIVELEKSLRDIGRTAEKEVDAKFEELQARVDKRFQELEEFEKASDERRKKSLDIARQYDESLGYKEQRIYNEQREQLEDSLRGYFADRIGFAALQPDAKTRAMMLQGTQPGTWEGTGMRLISQFKSFSFSFTQKVLGREVYGYGANSMIKGFQSGQSIMGIARLIVAATAFGYMSMAMKDLAKGREPRAIIDDEQNLRVKTLIAAMVQGGGMGIYGDFLFAEAKNRSGGTFLATLAGPSLGRIDELSALWARIRNGDDVSASAFRTALGYVPGSNLFWLRPILDYSVLYQIQESLSPGSVRRFEQTVSREQAQDWLLSPSQYGLR